jgi:hypothetical protein
MAGYSVYFLAGLLANVPGRRVEVMAGVMQESDEVGGMDHREIVSSVRYVAYEKFIVTPHTWLGAVLAEDTKPASPKILRPGVSTSILLQNLYGAERIQYSTGACY